MKMNCELGRLNRTTCFLFQCFRAKIINLQHFCSEASSQVLQFFFLRLLFAYIHKINRCANL